MTKQTAITITSAITGFVAAIFFCFGNALNAADQIAAQASTYWDFNGHLARSLASQRAQYVVGALLLVVSFCLQVAAALTSPTTHLNLPRWIQSWPVFVATVLIPTVLISHFLYIFLDKKTNKKVLELIQKEVTSSQNNSSSKPPLK